MKTDEELAAASARGDADAFSELMRRTVHKASSLAFAYTKNAEDAEDVAQDSFLKAWKHIKRFDPSKRFSTWLLTIVRNTSLDFLKKRRSISFSAIDASRDAADNDASSASFSESIVDLEPLADEIFERTETVELVTRALDTLHPDHRSALMLHYRDGMTFEEIALVVDAPMNTVKSWHRRALFKLKETLHRDSPQYRNNI